MMRPWQLLFMSSLLTASLAVNAAATARADGLDGKFYQAIDGKVVTS